MPATIARINALRQQYPSLQAISEVYHPSKANRYASHPVRCICGTAPALVDLNNAYGDHAAVKWLIAQLVSYQEGINTPNKMTPLQYSSLAETIASEFYYLKLTDIHLFITHLAAGSFNVDYHGYITPDPILQALRHQYIPYRFDVFRREEERLQKERERSQPKADLMTRAEYDEIRQLELMYEMPTRWNNYLRDE